MTRICQAETPAELWRAVRSYFNNLGFKGLAYFLVSRGLVDTIRGFTLIHRGFSPSVADVYVTQGLGQYDPAPTVVITRGVPMRWSTIWEAIDPDENQRRYLTRIREAGIGDGYSLPVYGPSGRNACIAVGRPAREEILDTAPVDEMHMIAQAAHMRLCQLLLDRPRIGKPLSARELEILDWVARGKSNSVIADILHLSGATVDTYLRRIYEKLEVSDRTSAAVRGVGMGLIAA
ncbi:MAG: autoinducer binding domain-containing protein [Sphingobium sp.]